MRMRNHIVGGATVVTKATLNNRSSGCVHACMRDEVCLCHGGSEAPEEKERREPNERAGEPAVECAC